MESLIGASLGGGVLAEAARAEQGSSCQPNGHFSNGHPVGPTFFFLSTDEIVVLSPLIFAFLIFFCISYSRDSYHLEKDGSPTVILH